MTDDSLPYHRDAETSKDAAARKRLTVMGDRLKFYELILASGVQGVTDEEAHAAFEMSHGPRFKELADVGLIVRTMRTRPTQSGATSYVWVATVNLPASPSLLRWCLTGSAKEVEFGPQLWRKKP